MHRLTIIRPPHNPFYVTGTRQLSTAPSTLVKVHGSASVGHVPPPVTVPLNLEQTNSVPIPPASVKQYGSASVGQVLIVNVDSVPPPSATVKRNGSARIATDRVIDMACISTPPATRYMHI